MDTSTIAGASLVAKTAQTQLAMSANMIKRAAEQQTQMANILAQNTKNAPQPMADTLFSFSTYA